MDRDEIKAIIEALLFMWGDPLNLKEISKILELNIADCKLIMDEIINEFNFERRGTQIIQIDDSYQMCTRPEHYPWIKKLYNPRSTKNLSSAALETLSIIAYNQPVTKNEIEMVRGVRCDKAIDTLLENGIIEERGRLERTGRPIIYGTTKEFLKYFGLSSLRELPKLDDLEQKKE